jgi:hypothetical protein
MQIFRKFLLPKEHNMIRSLKEEREIIKMESNYRFINNKPNHQLKLKVMKTKNEKNEKYSSRLVSAVMFSLMLVSASVSAQETKTERMLFGPDVSITEVWAPEIKLNTIQGKTGTLVGVYGGALINNRVLLGFTGGVNLGHPTVNYGYFGGIAQVIAYPGKMLHVSGQLVVAYGTTKDYENPKSGLLDNFWNISGERFVLNEPGVNLEVNLSDRVTLVTGVSYRFVSGIDANNEYVDITHVTSQDMSGINFNIGLKITKINKK